MLARPQWRDVSGRRPRRVPSAVRAWLRLETSMTHALRRAFGVGLHVRVLHDAAGALLPDEAGALGTRRCCGHVREVALRDERQTRVVARTVYTRRAQGEQRALATLGSRPLGDVLFAAGQPRWRLRQFAVLQARMPLFALVRRAAGDVRAPCWARRTVFLFEHQRLLVTEIFMPAMFRRASGARLRTVGHPPAGC